MVARKGRAPFVKHSLETSLSQMRLRHVLRHIGQTETGQRRIEHLGSAVENELAFDAYLQFAAVFSNSQAYNPP